MENKIYDLIILGAGPAGLTAALYACRANLSVLVIEKPNIGSLIMAHKIDNYPGVSSSPKGKELYNLMKNQLLQFDIDFEDATFLGFDALEQKDYKTIKTDKANYLGRTVIIATGTNRNNFKKIPGESNFLGKGVSYCATCDGAFTKNMTVSLIGKGEEFAEEALFLTKFAKKINLFVTSDSLECDQNIFNSLYSNESVEIFYLSELLEIKGTDFVENILINVNGELKKIPSDFVFLYLGTKSSKELYLEVAKVDENGYIITDELMQTLTPGVYAAGDIRSKAIRQVTTATSDGTIASIEATKYIMKTNK